MNKQHLIAFGVAVAGVIVGVAIYQKFVSPMINKPSASVTPPATV